MHHRKGFRRRYTREDLNLDLDLSAVPSRYPCDLRRADAGKAVLHLELVLADPALRTIAWVARQREVSGAIADRSNEYKASLICQISFVSC